MKKIVMIFLVLVYSGAMAQQFGKKGTVYLSGNVKNNTDKFFEFAITGFFDNKISSVIFGKDGAFNHKFEIEGTQQDIYLYLNNDAVTFTVRDGDRLTINWDASDFRNSFAVKGATALSDQTAKIQWHRYLNFRPLYLNLSRDLYKMRDSLTKAQQFGMINDLFNKEVDYLSTADKTDRVISFLYPEIYFMYATLIYRHGLLADYRLQATGAQFSRFLKKTVDSTNHTRLNDPFFWTSVSYRDFLFNDPRFNPAYRKYYDTVKGFNPTLTACLTGKGIFSDKAIRNWFITKNILFGYKHYKFADVESTEQLFEQELDDMYLKELLSANRHAMLNLKPGNKAPGFTLKNEAGKNVSLSDFEGKVVYLDFWGVGCGPCIYDIENNGQKLHDKYKGKEIVFISVCVDANVKEWKAALKKYKMEEQVNLIAEGWTNHPTVKMYNVDAIPHYFIIDKEGRIINNTAPRMNELLGDKPNDIDKGLLL